MLESKIQSTIIKRLEASGCYVIKLGVTNKTGIPDLMVIHPDSVVEFIEVKRPGKKPTAIQQFRMKELQSFGIKTSIQYE